MKISYDPEADAAYISFAGKMAAVTTVRLSEDIAVDFGPGEEIVGIEILDAANNMRIGKRTRRIQLENLRAA